LIRLNAVFYDTPHLHGRDLTILAANYVGAVFCLIRETSQAFVVGIRGFNYELAYKGHRSVNQNRGFLAVEVV
jgi:hypothetical protein